DSALPEQFREGPEFLVGGFGTIDAFPSLYRVNVQENSCQLECAEGRCGAAWGGQADAVQRLLHGYDMLIRREIDALYTNAMHSLREQMIKAVTVAMEYLVERVGADAAEGLQITLPAQPTVSAPWDARELRLQYPNLPLQDAVDLAGFLVH